MYTKYLLSALLLATSAFTLQAQQDAPQDTTIHWRKHILDLKDSKGQLEIKVYQLDSTGTKRPSAYLFRGIYGEGRIEEQGTREHIRLPRPEIFFPTRRGQSRSKSKRHITIGGGSIGYVSLTGDGTTGLKRGSSLRYQFQLLGYHHTLSHKVTLSAGIHLQFNSLHLSGDYAYQEDNSATKLIHYTAPEGIRTSRLHITYLTLPLTLRIHPWEKSLSPWEFSFGAEFKLRTASSSKVWLGDYRTPRILGKDLGLNPLGLDLRAQIKCAPVGIYATYSLLPLFLDKGLPSTSMYSVGVSLGL